GRSVKPCHLRRWIVAFPFVRMNAAAFAGLAVGREKVRARAIQDRPDLGVATALQLCEATQIADEQLISRVIDWPLAQEGGQSSGCRSQRVLQRGRGTPAHGGRGEIRGASREKSIQRTPCDEAPFEQERQPLPRPRDAEL